MIWAWLACGPLIRYDDPIELPDEPPVITAHTVECKRDADRWAVAVDTQWWTGGGELWMTAGGAWFEDHGLRSTKAAGDGSEDHLEARLTIVPDWRDASPGSSTAFTCADTVGWRLFVLAQDGARADCVEDDPSGVLATIPELPACD